MQIAIKQFSELTTKELYEVLKLRSEVFVVEQDCIYQDIDGKDKKALHVLGHYKGKLVGYVRIFKSGEYFNNASFGRVVVAKEFRHLGFGKDMVEAAITNLSSDSEIEISAQTYLKRFYENFAFSKIGDEYLEDGIPHIRMVRKGKRQ